MLNRLNKLRKLWKLSNKSEHVHKFIENLDNEDIKQLPNESEKIVFLSDMTEDEYQEYIKDEEQGFKGIKEKLNKIIYGNRQSK